MIQTVRSGNDIRKVRFEIAARFSQLGITDEREMTAYIARNTKVRGDKRPILTDLQALLQVMDSQLNVQQIKKIKQTQEYSYQRVCV
ncbi:hypothetical protein [Brevibacillus porteri]|uniref:Uncharacterized protein n=1 Tax=Brevibacillus porteri TaxID=2126350 RepID=A0ABX5FJJ8_9BACL|nr:hypothetical protein [Brevibacillus porteri]MED1802988.1 hypothetical protein [Brevibacillus porteri]MED2134652.1 hypothetical protein [Brevibacillus porteri]MED2748169.1 hypothetical protein [Brevibacillus porteri]MED2817492.1 hypothetical protein [Brevibacillus porteri]MED2897800.1 hypothetical protein [Brevibacillus porteri]